MMAGMDWHIGCSGFHYKDWKGNFYPSNLPQRSWFQFYSTKFNTLELNSTFYKFPQLKTLQNWYNISPSDFRFSVKAPRLITHYKQFNDCSTLLSDFYATIGNGLGEKLGPALFQLPPRTVYDPRRLELLIKCMDQRFVNVIEFRDGTWWRPEVYHALEAANIIFCGISHPTLPDAAVANNAIAYYRFHGKPKLYYSQYEPSFLQDIAGQLMSSGKATRAFIYFNNTATNAAIENALWLRQFVTGP